MGTKVTVIKNGGMVEPTPIQFKHYLSVEGSVFPSQSLPKDYDHIELIKCGHGEYDIMFAYNDFVRECGVLYLGHFNDGVV